jgi:hypothetical protein
MSELAYGLFEHTYNDLMISPITPADTARATLPLPPPMHRGNFQSVDDRCLIGPRFQKCVAELKGFEWINDAPKNPRPKWGYVATRPGSRMAIKVNSMAASGNRTSQVGGGAAAAVGLPAVVIATG